MIHVPEDMTVRVDASVTLATLQSALAKSRQWLPLDPPNSGLSLRAILDRNESGPRRFGYGTGRDYVIGMKVTLADGRVVKSGGQVVKNVAGYDLQKLFVGSGGTLGTIGEVTFKLRPLPELEQFVQQRCASLEAAGTLIENIVESELTPIVFDLHRLPEHGLQPASASAVEPASKRTEVRAPFIIVLGFDGMMEDVDWQLALATKLGFQQPATLDYDKAFRAEAGSLQKLSALPSKLIEVLRGLGDEPFVARAGNGIIYHRANIKMPPQKLPTHLQRRIKEAFDPKHLLPELPA
jgi:glycolate oxidase FAD binding subunit